MSFFGLPAYRQSYLRLGLSAAVLAAALWHSATSTVQAEELIRLPLTSDIGSFDPDNSFEMGGLAAINNVYEGLVEYDPETNALRGLLAKSWTISDDQLVYTFTLVDGATFHDGTPLTADAVVTSFKRRAEGELILSYFLWNMKSIEAQNENTVVLTLGMPQPSFLDTMASPWGPKVISPAALEANAGEDNGKTWLNTNAVGTGPFKLASFDRGQGYSLEKFEDYYGEKAFFDVVELPLIPDISQQLLNLQSQETDAVPTNYPWAQLKSLPSGLEVTSNNSTAMTIGFIKPGSVLEDAALRTAFLTAINPARWVADAYGDYAQAAKSLFPIAMFEPTTPYAFPTDLEAAKAIVTEKGPVSVTIGISTEDANSVRRLADLMVAELAAIGITAQVNVLPAGAQYGLSENPNGPDFYFSKLTPDALHPETQATLFFTKTGALNFYGRANEDADALVNEAGTLTDVAARNALYEQASTMYIDSGLFIPLAEVKDVVVHAEGLTGIGLRSAYPNGNIDYGTIRWAE